MRILISDPTYDTFSFGIKEEFHITVDGEIIGGKYWLFSDNITDYYVWYKIDEEGVDPNIENRTGIMVESEDGNNDVAITTDTIATLNDSAANISVKLSDIGQDNAWHVIVNSYSSVSNPTIGNTDLSILLIVEGKSSISFNYTKNGSFALEENYRYRAEPISDNFSSIDYTTNLSTLKDITNNIWGIVFNKSNDFIDLFSHKNDILGTIAQSMTMDISKEHAISCRNWFIEEDGGIIGTTNIYASSLALTGLYPIIDLLSQHNFDIVSRSTTGLNTDLHNVYGTYFWNNLIGIVHSHYDNTGVGSPEGCPALDIIVAAGAGNYISENLGDHCSYGNGLEFYLYDSGNVTSESEATPKIASMIAKLMTNHSNWNFHDCRQSLRQTASFEYWIAKGGFGEVNYTTANGITDADLLSMSPFRQSITANEDSVDFTWLNSPQSIFDKTIVAKFDSEPSRDATPTTAQIIYEGILEEFNYNNYGTSGTFWFVFMTKNSEGNYSKIESYDKHEKSINISKNRRMMFSDVRSPLVNRWN